jgi:RNA polymerase sigma-70 factor (ECF subfamily)
MTNRDHPWLQPAGDTASGEETMATCGSSEAQADASPARLRGLVDRYYDFVWRTVRFHGVPDANAEDAAQQVFCIVARRLGEILPVAEASFLFSTSVRVASEARRTARRRPVTTGEDEADAIESPMPSPEDLLDQQRAREVLREVLAEMSVDLQTVFVLYEIEELTLREIASMLSIPEGTATSRLRRAREEFRGIVKRRQATRQHGGRGSRT